jgi:HlyD family secretion protein
MARNVSANNAMPASAVDDRLTEVHAAEAQIATAQLRKLEAQQKIRITEAQADVAKQNISVGEASAQSAAASVNVLKAQLEDAYIYSPFDGVVTEKAAEVGEIVAPISIGGSMARGSIVTIAEWNSLQAEVDVAETYIHRIKAGQRAAISVDAFPDKTFPGKTLRILPRANRSKATVLVRVDFLQRDSGVLPEMGVRVRFLPDDAPPGAESGAAKDMFAIPKAAVQSAGDEKFVWVVNPENTSRKAVVTTGETKDDLIEVLSGVNANELVAIKGAAKLTQNGQKVRITRE